MSPNFLRGEKNNMKIGLDRVQELKKQVKGKRVSVVCNISSVNSKYEHVVAVLKNCSAKVVSIMGPQHGFVMDKQDNMKESPHSEHDQIGVPVYSLYGDSREPKDYMLKDTDVVIFDLQDVGARYYTFIYTMANTMRLCAELNIPFLVLDRPNPINGFDVEGGIVVPGFESFVGMFPISNRHGMTVGELAYFFNEEFEINCKLKIIKMEGWKRSKYWDELKLEWIIPSPNMPYFETTLVYPGQCLLEATNISEGRGTTRPFEIFGAPFISHSDFLKHSAIKSLKGCVLRPLYFEPTFNKFKGEVCKGFQIHVTDKSTFKPLKTSLAIIYALYELCDEFRFTPPPYEYEFNKQPIDILLGSDVPRTMLSKGVDFKSFYSLACKGDSPFKKRRQEHLIY